MEKINDEDLKKLRDFIANLNQGQLQVGQLESQKYLLLNEVQLIQKEFFDFQSELKDRYGNISINIEDGSYVEEKKEDAN
ncbi:MAG: hypothetical protein ACO393_02910 [Methylophilaceae bacterium]